MITAEDRQTQAGFANSISRAFADGTPVVCFANDLGGDPTSKHHIMRAYAQHTDVLWVEASGMRVPNLSQGHDLRRIAGRLRSAARGVRKESDRLHVLSPLSIPIPASPLARVINEQIYRWSVQRALRQLGMRRDPLLWVYTPTVAPYLSGMPRSGLVYHCVDRWWEFEEYDAQVMRACHATLCREADVVFASSAALLDDCREHTDRAYLMRHGVEWEHFARAALDPPSIPADIDDIDGPVLGFFGLIHEWVDQELLCGIADAFPDATIVLIGKVQVDVTDLRSRPNVRFVGQKPYASLPAYASAFDVALIPFVLNELTVAVNPIKLREYLSAGVPVVATALPEIELFGDNPELRTATSTDEHVNAIRHYLERGRDDERRRETALAMASESWLGRCAEMADLTREHLSRP